MQRVGAVLVALLILLLMPVQASALEGDGLGADPFASAAAAELVDVAALSAPPSGFIDQTVFSDLIAPTAVRFASNGHVFVAEKAGRVLEFDSVTDTTPTVFADMRTNVIDFEDRGLLGMEVDPQFTTGRPYVYVLYAYDKDPFTTQVPRWGDDCPTPPGPTADGCVVSGRLSRFTAGGTEDVLITDWCQQYTSHSIGDLHFGPDGALYVSAGDGASYTFADYGQRGNPRNPCGDPPAGRGGVMTTPTAEGGALRSQDVRTAGDPTGADGSILRVNPDTGAAMPDNPNAASSDAMTRRIVAHGFRNPFRFTIRPGTNEVWASDVGWNTWEELNRIASPTTSMTNYGWPCYEGAGRMSAYDGLNVTMCESLYGEGAAAVVPPYFSYRHADQVVAGEACPAGTSSIAGVAFYDGAQFPDRYRDGLFVSDYSRSCVWFMPAGADGLPDPAQRETFASGVEGVVGLTVGPDGSLYYPDINNGAIKRFTFPAANLAPTARASGNPTSGPTPLTVQFDGSQSSDGNGDTLAFAWDLDGDGQYDDSTSETPTWTYTTPGPVNARLRVTDPGGLQGIDTVPITAGTPPTASIDTPVAGTTWAVGDEIDYEGSGAGDMSWRLLLQHCFDGNVNCHTHVIQSWSGVSRGSLIAPDHEYPSYLELELTVRDVNGLTDTDTRRLDPKTVELTFESGPPGLQLSVGSFTGTTPFTRTLIQGSSQSVSAPGQGLDGRTYAFRSWSDGGAQNHLITVGASDATYRAEFDEVLSVPGLVGAWGFDEGSGDQALDATGRSGAGVISGATRAPGRFGGGLAFDGIDDWVTVADAAPLRLSGAMTLEAWVNATTLAGAWRTAILKERNAGLSYALYANDGASHAAGYLNLGSNDTGALSPVGSIPLSTWTHLAATFDGAVVRLYVNGTQVGTRSIRGTIANAASPLRFGGNSVWDEFFNGRLDEIRIYDRALTAAQISSDMTTPINTTPPAPAALSVSPASLSFSATEGGASPASKSLSVANTGGGTLSFTASDDAPWLSVAPGSGTAPQALTVTADVSGLAPGTYDATVTVTAAGAQGSPATVPVSFTVDPAPPPALSVSPSSLSFAGTEGGANPATKSLAVSNTGGGSLSFTAADDASWLSVTPGSGSAPQSLTVAADMAGLAPGTYNATVTITAPGAQGSPAAIPVSLTVEPQPVPELAVAPASLAFSATTGGATPASKTLDVMNAGGGTLSFSVSDDAPWLGVTPTGGTAPQTLTVTATQAGLAAGSYSGTITVTASGANGSPRTVPVTFTVTSTPPTPGLVAAYAFDEAGGSTVDDASGAGNPGVISGATRTAAGRNGAALSFDGVNDWITVADAAALRPSALTLEAWVNPTVLAGAWRTVMLKERSAGLAYALYANDSARHAAGFVNVGSFDTGALSPVNLVPLNAWTHLATTFDGVTSRLYLNGAQVATRTVRGSIVTSTGPLRIGGNAVWNEWFAGRIDDVRVYNRVLPAAEIRADMNRGVGAGAVASLSAARKAGRRVIRRHLRSARRHSSVKRERARRKLPLARHVVQPRRSRR